MDIPDHALLPPSFVAELLNLSRWKLRAAIDSGELLEVRTEGGHRRIPAWSADRYRKAHP